MEGVLITSLENAIRSISSEIATFLEKENSKTYTGHAFRRTSVTLSPNKGLDELVLKRHAGWKNSGVVESYAEGSILNTVQFANKILRTSSSGSSPLLVQFCYTSNEGSLMVTDDKIINDASKSVDQNISYF